MNNKSTENYSDIEVDEFHGDTVILSPEMSSSINELINSTDIDMPSDTVSEQVEAEKLQDLKTTLLDSAELATRGASLAVKAGVEMHHAAEKLIINSVSQHKLNKIVLISFAAVMSLTIILFSVLAFRLQSKISQLDAMVLAVGKRVVTMDASIELVAYASDLIKDVSSKQDALSVSQVKLETRIDESIKSSQIVPDLKAKSAEDKTKELIKLVQNLETRFQNQNNSTKLISDQIKKLQASLPDPKSFKRELESASKLIKEQRDLEVITIVPSPVIVKPKVKIVQFPRVSPATTLPEKTD